MDYRVTDAEMTTVADAIRMKGGHSRLMEWYSGFVTEIGKLGTAKATDPNNDGNVVVTGITAISTEDGDVALNLGE